MLRTYGYDGTVLESDAARIISQAGGIQYGVAGLDDLKVTRASGDRNVSVAPGTFMTRGLLSDNTEVLSPPAFDPVSSGTRWDLLAIETDFASNLSQPVIIKGGVNRVLPTRPVNALKDYHPLALVPITSVTGGSVIGDGIVDLRVWAANGGLVAADELALTFLTGVGTDVTIGRSLYKRTPNDTKDGAVWRRMPMTGGILDVLPLVWWPGLAASGSTPGVQHWGTAATQTIASLVLPDPGVPYRVQLYAAGYWGNEFNDGTRYDFDATVGGDVIAIRTPPAGDFYWTNWREWSPHPSRLVFTGAKTIGLRARRIQGPSLFGVVRKSDTNVLATIFSA